MQIYQYMRGYITFVRALLFARSCSCSRALVRALLFARSGWWGGAISIDHPSLYLSTYLSLLLEESLNPKP